MRRTPVIDGKYFRALDEEGQPVTPERVCQARRRARAACIAPPTAASCRFFGDLHPSFAGNVVKAMGGAKQGYPVLTRTHGRSCRRAERDAGARSSTEANDDWRARVVRGRRG